MNLFFTSSISTNIPINLLAVSGIYKIDGENGTSFNWIYYISFKLLDGVHEIKWTFKNKATRDEEYAAVLSTLYPVGTGGSSGESFTLPSNIITDDVNFFRASDDSVIVFDKDVKGGAINLNSRISTISNFASPNAGGIISGQYYDNSFQGSASSTLAAVANRIDMAPYYSSDTYTINQIGVATTTAIAGSLIKIVIYTTLNGWPDQLLLETTDIDASSIGFVGTSVNFTFNSGVQYWVGVRTSSTSTLRTIAVASAVNLGILTNNAVSYATILRRTIPYGDPAPNNWEFGNTDRVANITPPSIRFRAA